MRSRYTNPMKLATQLFVESKLKYIFQNLKIENDTSILDVGAGTGIFTYYLIKHSKKVLGVDISEQLIKKSPCRDKLILADAFSLPFKDNAFDIVLTSCLLHHVDDPLGVIRELVRTTKKYLIICEPNRNNPLMFIFSLIIKCERAGLKFSRSFLKKLISNFKTLKILTLDSIGVITPNNMPSSIAVTLRKLDRKFFLGCYNILIAQKI